MAGNKYVSGMCSIAAVRVHVRVCCTCACVLHTCVCVLHMCVFVTHVRVCVTHVRVCVTHVRSYKLLLTDINILYVYVYDITKDLPVAKMVIASSILQPGSIIVIIFIVITYECIYMYSVILLSLNNICIHINIQIRITYEYTYF